MGSTVYLGVYHFAKRALRRDDNFEALMLTLFPNGMPEEEFTQAIEDYEKDECGSESATLKTKPKCSNAF